jgi:large subunit ribosomal protein L23
MPADVAPHYVIKRPLLTEKGTWGMNEQGRYVFEVDPRATKTEIKNAVETLYKVRVEKVNTQVRKGKFRRFRYGLTVEPKFKRAIVRLHADDQIELF